MGVLLKRRHALGAMLVQQPAHDTVLMFWGVFLADGSCDLTFVCDVFPRG
jgi:hypothetical protein